MSGEYLLAGILLGGLVVWLPIGSLAFVRWLVE